MRQQPMRQFTITCLILSVAAFLGSIIVAVLGATSTAPATLRIPAISIMIITLLLPLAFVVAQLFPAGREPVRVRGFGHDAWASVIVFTAMPGVLWSRLGALAGAPVNLLMPGFVTPLVISVILLLGRQVQQRNIRGFSDRSARPVA
jgi:hypothetical protein